MSAAIMRYPVWLLREAAVTWDHAGWLARHGLAHVAMQRRGMVGMPQARDVGTSAFTDHQSSAPWRQGARTTDRGERVEVVVTVR
jgi:2-methylcitrate dehydratase PrpD